MPAAAGYYLALSKPASDDEADSTRLSSTQAALAEWAANLPLATLESLLTSVQQYLTMRVLSEVERFEEEPQPRGAEESRKYVANGDEQVQAAAVLLGLIHRANALRREQATAAAAAAATTTTAAGSEGADTAEGEDETMTDKSTAATPGTASGTDTTASATEPTGAAAPAAAGGTAGGSTATAAMEDEPAGEHVAPSEADGEEVKLVRRNGEAEPEVLPDTSFVNETVCEHVDAGLDVLALLGMLRREQVPQQMQFSFAQRAVYLLDLPTKAELFHLENRVRQRAEAQANVMEVSGVAWDRRTGGCKPGNGKWWKSYASATWQRARHTDHAPNCASAVQLLFGGMESMYLKLEIHRDSLVRDAVTQLSGMELMSPERLRRPLRIVFVGEEVRVKMRSRVYREERRKNVAYPGLCLLSSPSLIAQTPSRKHTII